MKILIFTAFAPFGSGEVFSIEEIVALRNSNVSVTVAPRTYGQELCHKNAQSLMDVTLNYKLFDVRNLIFLILYFIKAPIVFLQILRWSWIWAWTSKEFFKALLVMPKAFRIAWTVRNSGINHIHSTNTTSMVPMAYVVSRCLNVPWSFTLHSWWPSFSLRRIHFETMIESASFCRVISRHALSQLNELISESLRSKCYAIHIGTECAEKSCAVFCADKDFVIASPANVELHKGPDIAIEAANLLISRGYRNFKWYFYGAGTLKSGLSSQIFKTPLASYFFFPGVIANDELLKKYASGTINVVALPSIERSGMPEGIPHALIQAIGYGIPVISTNSGGTAELLDSGGGIGVSQGSPVELADVLIKLFTSEEFYNQQAIQGLSKARNEFNIVDSVNSLTNLFSRFSITE